MKIKKRLALLVFSLLLAGCNDAETVENYIKSGKELYEQGHYDKARIEFKNAIQINSQQADAFYHLSLMDEKDNNVTAMYRNLSQVVQITPDKIEARLKLAVLLLLSNNLNEVTEQIDAILVLSEHNLDALALKAAVLLKQEKIDEANKIVDDILLKNTSHLSAIQLKVAIYSERQNYKAALVIINKALENNSEDDSLALNQLKLQILNNKKDYVALEKQYLFLIKKFPEKIEFNYRLADYYYQRQQADKALVILEGVINRHPKLLKPKLALINILNINDPLKAENKIKGYLSEDNKEAEFYFSLAKLYNLQKKPQQATEQLNLLIKNSKNKTAISNAKVLLASNEKDLTVATQLIDEVLDDNEHHFGGLLLKIKIKLKKAQYDDAIIELRNLLEDYPESDNAMVLLAKAYLSTDSQALAEEYFRKALVLNAGNESATLYMTSKAINEQNFPKAEGYLQTALNFFPNNTRILLKLAEIRFLQKDWSGAQEVVILLTKNSKNLGVAKYVAGRILQGQHHYLPAITKYKQALKHSPNLFSAIEGMVLCYESLNQRASMQHYLQQYITQYPDQPRVMSLQAKLYGFDKNWEKSLAILMMANQKWPTHFSFYEQIAQIFKVKKDQERTISTYERGLKNIPENIYLAMNLASLYEQQGKYKSALTVYEKFLITQPKSHIAINNLVALLVDYFPSKDNLQRAMDLSQQFSESIYPHLLDTYGWTLLVNGETQKALTVLKNVVEKAPKVAVFRYHLAQAYTKVNQTAEAISELEQALKISEKQSEFSEKKQAILLLKELKS